MKYAWIEQHRDSYSITLMCELLGASRSGLHAARDRAPSPRAREDAQLVEHIRRGQRKHRGRYGRRRMTPEISATIGRAVNHKRIARLMREHGLHHSDRGSQYAAYDYRKVLRARGITVSMSRKADCWDNAPMESFNGTLKVECVHGEHFQTREQAVQAIIEFIGYYNTERRHSSLGYVAPSVYEQRWLERRLGDDVAAEGAEMRGAAPPPPAQGV